MAAFSQSYARHMRTGFFYEQVAIPEVAMPQSRRETVYHDVRTKEVTPSTDYVVLVRGEDVAEERQHLVAQTLETGAITIGLWQPEVLRFFQRKVMERKEKVRDVGGNPPDPKVGKSLAREWLASQLAVSDCSVREPGRSWPDPPPRLGHG
jgi:hypothetical protein